MRISLLLSILFGVLLLGSINAQSHQPSSGEPDSASDQARGDQILWTNKVYDDFEIWGDGVMTDGSRRGIEQDTRENRMSRIHGIKEEQQREEEMKGGLRLRRGLLQKVEAVSGKIGSRPPACGKLKCKGCTPCTPVQVTVPPAQTTLPADSTSAGHHLQTSALPYFMDSPYYSVAWKCRCKGQLFNP